MRDYRCRLDKCRYHAAKHDSWSLGDCRYLDITGHAKTKQMKPEELEQWRRGEIRCPCYEEGTQPRIRRKSNNDGAFPVKRQKRRKDWTAVENLYKKGLNDWQIARALGIHASSVQWWRRSEGLPANCGAGCPPKKGNENNETT